MDNQPVGDVSFLRSVDPESVQQVQFFTPTEASMRWAGNNEGGAILITRRH